MSEPHERDADFNDPLRRVAYEEGMLLGLEAVGAEQDYHRRRLNRHQHWFHGCGTLVGLGVDTLSDGGRTLVRVAPGLALDRYGREVTVPEAYAIDLRDWLDDTDDLALARVDGVLRLKVTIRWEVCERGFQPVLARRLNVAIEPVAPSRLGDGFLIELLPDEDADDERDESSGPHGWRRELPDAASLTLTDADADTLAAASDADRARVELHARRLHAFAAGLPAPETGRLAEGARVLLARLELPAPDLAAIDTTPAAIRVDNLVRPFVHPVDAPTNPGLE